MILASVLIWRSAAVISNTADVHEFGAEIAADRGQIRMRARAHVGIEPKLAILRAKNNVKDDFTE